MVRTIHSVMPATELYRAELGSRLGLGCCCNGGGGLGQAPAEIDGARRILVGMIHRESGRIAGLADTPAVAAIRAKISEAVRWARSATWRQQDGKAGDALESASVGIRIMHEVSRSISSLSPRDKVAAGAQAQAQAGASVTYQVGRTLGGAVASVTEPIASVAELVSPAAAEVVRSSGWLLPIGAGLVLFFMLRR